MYIDLKRNDNLEMYYFFAGALRLIVVNISSITDLIICWLLNLDC